MKSSDMKKAPKLTVILYICATLTPRRLSA